MGKGLHYDVEMKRWMQMGGGGGILMCNLKGQMDKGGHYGEGGHDVQMKGWIQKGRHYDVQMKRWREL